MRTWYFRVFLLFLINFQETYTQHNRQHNRKSVDNNNNYNYFNSAEKKTHTPNTLENSDKNNNNNKRILGFRLSHFQQRGTIIRQKVIQFKCFTEDWKLLCFGTLHFINVCIQIGISYVQSHICECCSDYYCY